MDAEEIRCEALRHAVASVRPMRAGENMAAEQTHVISVAVLFQTFIAEGGSAAYRLLGVMDPAPVLRLVREGESSE